MFRILTLLTFSFPIVWAASSLREDIDMNKLAHQLITQQFPDWGDLPLTRVESAGTDNIIFRLGTDKVMRLPRYAEAAALVAKELLYLPKFASHLPLAIPTPIAKGEPCADFSWNWSIYHWLEGKDAVHATATDWQETARLLGEFIAALQQIDATDGPVCGRGVPLSKRDKVTRSAIADLNIDGALAVWEKALQAPVWEGSPVWLHADLHAGNLLVKEGKLSAVIDFGLMGVGDPACDVMVAWTYLPADVRDIFRKASKVDDATWARGRGWALSFGVVALSYHRGKNLVLSNIAQNTIDAILGEFYF